MLDGIALSIELTRLLGYYWLSGKLIGTLHIHGRYRSIDRDYQGQPSWQLKSDVFLCYQRPRVSCMLCNNFQEARPRQATEWRLAPLYDWASEASPTWMVHLRFQYNWASEASPTWVIHLGFFIGASAAKPHMDDTSAIFHIYIIYYYRRTSDRSNFAWRRTARRLTAHAHRCVKLKQGQSEE